MTILQQYVDWAGPLTYGSIPKDVAANAKNAILDTMAAMLGGVNEPVSRKLLAYQAKERTSGAATVVGSGYRFSAAAAALVNGAMSHALDYDDLLITTRSHPSAVLVPAILAAGETLKRSGAEVITAYLAGLEAIDKIGGLVAFAQYQKGWHTTSTLGGLGAAAAVGKLLGLPEQQMKMALGIAASLAGGLQRNFGTMTKPLHVGWAAQSGITAAMLAADGFTASEDVFSGKDNYLDVLAQKTDVPALPAFGLPFAVVSPGLYVKRYPCCFATHRALDAALHIRSRYPSLDVNRIDSITCMAPFPSFRALIHDAPATGLEGKFSMQYTVATALIDGRVDVRSFTDAMVGRTALRSLMVRIKKVEDPNLPLFDPDGTDRRFTEVTVRMTDGQLLTDRVVRPKGSADVPLTSDELAAKFLECSAESLPLGKQHIVLGMLRDLDVLRDISELMKELHTTGQAAAG
jgi:2-methylcitrate dehydratase PrpD